MDIPVIDPFDSLELEPEKMLKGDLGVAVAE